MKTEQELREFFKADRFVAECGIVIDTICEDYSQCYVDVQNRHLNANNVAQGGLVYTLADFCFAIHANREKLCVTQSATINYVHPPKGNRLIAKAKKLDSTRHTVIYEVIVTNENNVIVAIVQITGYYINVKA